MQNRTVIHFAVACALAITSVLTTEISFAAKTQYLGLVERTNRSELPYVMPAFYRTDNLWQSMMNLENRSDMVPGSVRWNIAFDGRSLGSVDSVKLRPYYNRFPFDLTYSIVDREVPLIRGGGFGSAKMHVKERPLVANSMLAYKDPEQWKPVELPAAVQQTTIAELRVFLKHFAPEKLNASLDGSPVSCKSYRNNDGSYIANVAIKGSYFEQDFEADCMYGHYLIRPDGTAVNLAEAVMKSLPGFLGAKSYYDRPSSPWLQLDLLDAGDYDRDGKSEVLFWITSETHDGYALFSEGFGRVSVFYW